MSNRRSAYVTQVGSEDYKPISQQTEVDGIQIAAEPSSEVESLLTQGRVRQIVKGDLATTIVVENGNNKEATNITLHSPSVSQDPTQTKSCSIDIPALNIETHISDNGPSPNLITTIRRAMTDLYDKAISKQFERLKAKSSVSA